MLATQRIGIPSTPNRLRCCSSCCFLAKRSVWASAGSSRLRVFFGGFFGRLCGCLRSRRMHLLRFHLFFFYFGFGDGPLEPFLCLGSSRAPASFSRQRRSTSLHFPQ